MNIPALRIATCILLFTSLASAENWPRFRGPNGSGVAENIDFPESWKDNDYAWKVDVPGIGHSSPVIWGDMIFLQSGSKDGSQRIAMSFEAKTGKVRWTHYLDSKQHKKHGRNSFGSSTPAADETGVYMAWGSPEGNTLSKFTHDGVRLWEAKLGPYQCNHGPAISPMVIGDLVICPMLQGAYRTQRPGPGEVAKPGTILAFNRQTGKPAWQATMGSGKASFSVPCIHNTPGGPELVCCNTANGMFGLDPKTGEETWSLGVFKQRTVSSPIVAGDLLIGSTGSGGGGNYVVAVDPKDATPEEKFRFRKQAPYVPTPVYHNGLLFLWSDKGIASCIEIESGDTLWSERASGPMSGSPICVSGRLIGVDEEGTVTVLDAARTYRKLGQTKLPGPSRATPAAAQGRVFFRTETQLMALGSGSKS
ncbi:MAG: PQQ-binding-like beta-propeller repeat protein [Planctomycetota bacterium]